MKGAIPKTARFLVALALLPFLWAEFAAIPVLAPGSFAPDFPFVSSDILFLFGGMALWFVVAWRFRVNPWFYVLGHELTHAAWALLTFSKVGRISVTSRGGYCTIDKPGVFTTLAPYFVPFYLALLLILRAILSIWFVMAPYGGWWMGAFGFAYGFHVTNTIDSIVGVDQPDIREYGRVFSCVLIAVANMLFLLLGFAAAAGTPFADVFGALADAVLASYLWVWREAVWVWREAAAAISRFRPVAFSAANW